MNVFSLPLIFLNNTLFPILVYGKKQFIVHITYKYVVINVHVICKAPRQQQAVSSEVTGRKIYMQIFNYFVGWHPEPPNCLRASCVWGVYLYASPHDAFYNRHFLHLLPYPALEHTLRHC